ncbi:MarR family winged helix-turn-helix transcriptional regulator [Hydrogenophaga sp.]|uniref:MarR family winged helix-turn-helix transcriptional regulator n=1 Tax=Hydrogenophaga sp. TaxID=1904254 RepID=UPI003F6C97B5
MRPTHPETPPKLERYFTYRLNTLSKLNDLASHSLYLTQGGLSLSESRALASIGSFPQITVNQLAFEANLDKGQASRAAQSLVDKGLVIKTHNLVDGRSVILALAPKGKPVWRKLMALMEQRNQALTGCLTPEEQAQLLNMFERMLARAQAEHAGQATHETP